MFKKRARWVTALVVVAVGVFVCAYGPQLFYTYVYSEWQPAHEGSFMTQSPRHSRVSVALVDFKEEQVRIDRRLTLEETRRYYRVRCKLVDFFPGKAVIAEEVTPDEWNRLAMGEDVVVRDHDETGARYPWVSRP